jgi:hypothetical protein
MLMLEQPVVLELRRIREPLRRSGPTMLKAPDILQPQYHAANVISQPLVAQRSRSCVINGISVFELLRSRRPAAGRCLYHDLAFTTNETFCGRCILQQPIKARQTKSFRVPLSQ